MLGVGNYPTICQSPAAEIPSGLGLRKNLRQQDSKRTGERPCGNWVEMSRFPMDRNGINHVWRNKIYLRGQVEDRMEKDNDCGVANLFQSEGKMDIDQPMDENDFGGRKPLTCAN